MSNKTGLNPKQLRLIELLADPTDTRTNEEKYAEVGVSRKSAWMWTKRAEYRDALTARVSELLTTVRAAAIRQIGFEIGHGDTSASRVRAAEVLLRLTDSIGTGNVNITTNVKVNEIAAKSDEELEQEIAECDAVINRVKALADTDV